jgi:2-succinyl-5-enolpyruvyl-6-hydroxy-3-cyclohexene-1-carboxylate synthase
VVPFCQALAARVRPAEGVEAWRAKWAGADRGVHDALDAFFEARAELSEPRVARLVTRHRPAGQPLVLASSMPVRDVTRYGDAQGPGGLVVANRGASGIDGTVATAAGVAHAAARPVTLLTGDLALLHDQSSLPLLRDAPVVVVVLNNDGGGIFHFLPIAAHADVFEPYFGTPHGLTFEAAARMVGLPYHHPATPQAFVETYRAACASGASALIEVTTDRAANRALHAELAHHVASPPSEAESPKRPRA